MNKIEEIKERIYKHCPELKELTMGCILKTKFGDVIYIDKYGSLAWEYSTILYLEQRELVRRDCSEKGFNHFFEILGHPIHLEHVLRAMKYSNLIVTDNPVVQWNDFDAGVDKIRFSHVKDRNFNCYYYDLTKSFDQNCENPELIDFLLEVIK